MLQCNLWAVSLKFLDNIYFQYDDGIHLLFHVDHPKVVPLQITTVSPMSVLLLEASVLGSNPVSVAFSYACVMFILWNLMGKYLRWERQEIHT